MCKLCEQMCKEIQAIYGHVVSPQALSFLIEMSPTVTQVLDDKTKKEQLYKKTAEKKAKTVRRKQNVS